MATATALSSLQPGRKHDEMAQRVIRMFKVRGARGRGPAGGRAGEPRRVRRASVCLVCVRVWRFARFFPSRPVVAPFLFGGFTRVWPLCASGSVGALCVCTTVRVRGRRQGLP